MDNEPNTALSQTGLWAQSENFLASVRAAVKLYDRYLDPLRSKYGLSKLELVIIGFLHNNPGKDTVGEIAALRALSKGNVSRGADALLQKNLVRREQDKKDRRWVHLILEPSAMPIIAEIEQATAVYKTQLLKNFTAEECEQYAHLNQKMLENIHSSIVSEEKTEETKPW